MLRGSEVEEGGNDRERSSNYSECLPFSNHYRLYSMLQEIEMVKLSKGHEGLILAYTLSVGHGCE